MEILESIDKELFLYLNRMHQPWLDQFMVLISSHTLWVIVFLILGITLYCCNKSIRELLFYAGSVFLAIGVTNLVKIFIKRPRPIHYEEWEGIIHNIDKYSKAYSFFSSHASSVFCIAIFILLSLKHRRWVGVLALIWAFLVSYSRIYVGKHFPGDVLIGALVGCLIALVGYQFYRRSE